MIDEKQSSILRPKPVPPMFTPVLTPNTQSMNMNTTPRGPSQAVIEMGSMIRKYDPEATRLYDCIAQVKVFSYNSTELRWENSPNLEGNLCAYERQQVINNKTYPSYAFAIFCGEKSLIQPVTVDMAQHADKLRLFYEVARNGRREVFCLHFLTEAECLRLHTFLTRCIQALKTLAEQQARAMQAVPAPVQIEPQQTQSNGQGPSALQLQQTPTNAYRQQQQQQQQQQHHQQQQQPMMVPNQTTPQYASRMHMNPTPTRLVSAPIPPPQMPIDLNSLNLQRVTPTINQIEMPKPLEQTPFPPSPIPLVNGNNNTEDPTSSLKRLLNIRGQSGLEGLSIEDNSIPRQLPPPPPQQQQQQAPPPPQLQQTNPLDLMPPSAFEPITATPPSPVVAIGAERGKHRLSSQFNPPMTREHFRNVLLHLVQTDDHFLDIIYQACLNYSTQ